MNVPRWALGLVALAGLWWWTRKPATAAPTSTTTNVTTGATRHDRDIALIESAKDIVGNVLDSVLPSTNDAQLPPATSSTNGMGQLAPRRTGHGLRAGGNKFSGGYR